MAVIIPAYNEERSLPLVLAEIPAGLVELVIVVDNASTDETARVGREGRAQVVSEPRRGYGAACLSGVKALPDGIDIVVFLDGDHSDHPAEMMRLVEPIRAGDADLVIGSRTLGERTPGALPPQAYWGNKLAVTLIRWFWGHRYTDLGPFRAIRAGALRDLGMRDRDFGWTVEMQIRALVRDLRVVEVPVSYRARIGKSKITGTLRGSLAAGAKILYTIARFAIRG